MKLIPALIFILFSSLSYASEDTAVDFIAMARAAGAGDIASVRALLERGIDPDGKGINPGDGKVSSVAVDFGRPLQEAAGNGRFDIVKLLIENGANPNWCCCECVTALHMAIFSANQEIAKYLIYHGADTNLPYSTRDKEYPTSYELALDKGLISTATLIKKKNAQPGN